MTKIICQRAPWSNSIEIAFAEQVGHRHAWAQPLVFVETEPGLLIEPAIKLTNDAAQELMDELWRAGLRPTEGSGSAGSLRATERHLEDMRKLALDLVADKLKATP